MEINWTDKRNTVDYYDNLYVLLFTSVRYPFYYHYSNKNMVVFKKVEKMREIFTEEFKQFMKKHSAYEDENKMVRWAKDVEESMKIDPRWVPEILNIENKEDCPNNVEGFFCEFGVDRSRYNKSLNSCNGPDKCWVLEKE